MPKFCSPFLVDEVWLRILTSPFNCRFLCPQIKDCRQLKVKLSVQLVSTCSRLVQNLYCEAKRRAPVSFAYPRGELKDKNRDALFTNMDI